VTGLNTAIIGLEQALDRPRRHQMWRWLVRHRVASVLEALAGENARAVDAWLASRQSILVRERDALLLKLNRLAGQILEAPDVEPVRDELKRAVSELGRHHQRLNDLVYDTVALELGGSE
jgi:membrane protein required for beta-lactamase induction